MGKRVYFLLAFLEAKFYTRPRLLLGLLKVPGFTWHLPCGRKFSFGVSWMNRKVLSCVVMRSMFCSPYTSEASSYRWAAFIHLRSNDIFISDYWGDEINLRISPLKRCTLLPRRRNPPSLWAANTVGLTFMLIVKMPFMWGPARELACGNEGKWWNVSLFLLRAGT